MRGSSGIKGKETGLEPAAMIAHIVYNKIEKFRSHSHSDTTMYLKIQENSKTGIIRLDNLIMSTFISPIYKTIYYSSYKREYYCRTKNEEHIIDTHGKFLRKVGIDDGYSEVEEVVEIDFDNSYLENRIHYPIFEEFNNNEFQGLITTDREKINREWVITADTLPAIYDTIIRAYYNEPCYIVSIHNKWGAVKPDGEYIVPPIYDSIDIKSMVKERKSGQLDRYRFVVKLNGKLGVVGNVDQNGGISNNGYQLLPIIYESILMDYGKDFYFVQLNNKFGVVSVKTYNMILEPKYDKISDKISYYKGFKFFQVRPAKDSEYVYVGSNGIEYFR